ALRSPHARARRRLPHRPPCGARRAARAIRRSALLHRPVRRPLARGLPVDAAPRAAPRAPARRPRRGGATGHRAGGVRAAMIHRIELKARENRRYSYAGRSVLITNIDGGIGGSKTNEEGFYFRNTRILSHHEVTAGKQELKPFIASPVDGHFFLAYARV